MDRFEIVDPRSNGEAVFSAFRPKWLLNPKTAKMAMSRTKQAGSECTLSKPLSCPNNWETLNFSSAFFERIADFCLLPSSGDYIDNMQNKT